MVVADSTAASMPPPVELTPTKTSTPLIVVKQQVYDSHTSQPLCSDDSSPNDSREGDDEKSVPPAVSTRSASFWHRFRFGGAFGSGGGNDVDDDEQKVEDTSPMESGTAMTTPPPPSPRVRRSASFTSPTASASPSPLPPRGRSRSTLVDTASLRLRLPRRSVSPRPVVVGDEDEEADGDRAVTPRKRNILPKSWPKPTSTPPTSNRSWGRRLLPPTPTRSGVSWTPTKRTSPAGAAAIGSSKEDNNKKGWMIRDESPVRTVPMMEDDESTSVGGAAPQRPLITTDVVKSDSSESHPWQRHVFVAEYQQQPPPPLDPEDAAEAQETALAAPVLNTSESANVNVPQSEVAPAASMPPAAAAISMPAPAAAMPSTDDPPPPPYPLMSSSPGWAPFGSSPDHRRFQWHPSVTTSSHRAPPSVVEWHHANSDMVSSVGGCTMLEEDITTLGDDDDDRKPRHRVVVERALVDEEIAGGGGGGDRNVETREEKSQDSEELKEMHRKQCFLVVAIVAASVFTAAVAVAVAAVVLKENQSPRPGDSLFASGKDVGGGRYDEVSLSPSPTTLVGLVDTDQDEPEQQQQQPEEPEPEPEPEPEREQEGTSPTPMTPVDVAPSDDESPQFDELVTLVRRALPSVYQDSDVFIDRMSPQHRAIQWMVDHPFHGPEQEEALLLERFAAVTLFFSTQDDKDGETVVATVETSTWDFGELNFLSPHSPTCIWHAIGSELQPMGLFCLDPKSDNHDRNKTVTMVNIADNNLVGRLVPELQLFRDLEHLELMNNPLTGAVPVWMFDEGVFNKLETVRLGGCSFVGKLPSTIFQSRKKNAAAVSGLPLVHLYLSRNRLKGTIPDWAPGRLPRLETLSLQNNRLSGTIPSTVENLPRLEHLLLQGNSLDGTIPSTLGNLSFLKTLDFRDNLLQGKVPKELSNLSNLVELRLNNNPDLEGDINFLCDLPHLELLTADCTEGKGARIKCDCCQKC